MRFTEAPLRGAYVIELEPLADERGFFARSFCRKAFAERGLEPVVAQCNISFSHHKNTLRGMHYQVAPHAETKLVRCVAGSVYDVIVDLRQESSTYLGWHGVELSARTHNALYVPGGFAHGFITLSDDAVVTYQVSTEYTQAAERCVRWNDPAIGIRWPSTPDVISPRDAACPLLEIVPR